MAITMSIKANNINKYNNNNINSAEMAWKWI